MDPHRDEKALRRLVAHLARARPADIDAVLDELSVDQRLVVRELLDAYAGRPAPRAASAPSKAAGPSVDTKGFSNAIVQRLEPAVAGTAATWRMTEAAAEALRACARQTPADLDGPPPQAPLQRGRFQFLRAGLRQRELGQR